MVYRISVDIGGTFTDFCVFDQDTSELITQKVLSTPNDPGNEIINGVDELIKNKNLIPKNVNWFSHGTTVGINTVIQRTGSKLALFVTKNFEDVLEVARLKVPDPYNIFSTRPSPLVSRENVFGIRQRTLKDGTSEIDLDEKSVVEAVNAAINSGVDAIVVSLLHSYANPKDEKKLSFRGGGTTLPQKIFDPCFGPKDLKNRLQEAGRLISYLGISIFVYFG